MTTSNVETRAAMAVDLRISPEKLSVELTDGRTISVPLEWFPRLVHADQSERENWELCGNGGSIHWPDLDEDIGVEHLLAGIKSGESERSFNRWLQAKKEGRGITIPELMAYERSQERKSAHTG